MSQKLISKMLSGKVVYSDKAKSGARGLNHTFLKYHLIIDG